MKKIIKKVCKRLANWSLRVSEFAERMQKKNDDWRKRWEARIKDYEKRLDVWYENTNKKIDEWGKKDDNQE
jgi:hypothetical protein